MTRPTKESAAGSTPPSRPADAASPGDVTTASPGPQPPLRGRELARREFCARGLLPFEVDRVLDTIALPNLSPFTRFRIALELLPDQPDTVRQILGRAGYMPRGERDQ